jgi:parallel beta-helix repeat protein
MRGIVISQRRPVDATEPDPSATLWVDSVAGNDNNTRAQVRAGGGSVAWQTIGRAVWGNASRSSPSTSEAAEAGDVVSILGGASLGSPVVYTTDVSIGNGQDPVYLPVNTGSAGNYITFQANGYVQLGAAAANAPVVGNTGSIDYIKWYADRADSRFLIVCDGRFSPPVNIASSSAAGGVLTVNTSGAHGITNGETIFIRDHPCTPAILADDFPMTATVIDSDTFTINDQTYTAGAGAVGNVRQLDDVKADTSVVNTRPDTGPVFFVGHFWIEGFDIDGGEKLDFSDNWDGIRGANGQGFTIRNNWIHDFRTDYNEDTVEDTAGNHTGITLYGAQNGLIEHNLFTDNGAGIYFKDTLTYQATLGNTIRVNWFSGANIGGLGSSKGVNWSLVQTGLGHAQNFVYQNVIVDCTYAFSHQSSSWNDDVYNNTIARCIVAVDGPASCNGDRYWNNIFTVTQSVIYQESVPIPTATTCSLQHNCVSGFGVNAYAEDSTGDFSFAEWLAAYSSQDQDAIDTVNSSPLFTNAGADDFTLQSGSPARGIASDLGVGTDAGAYQYGVSVTIGLES